MQASSQAKPLHNTTQHTLGNCKPVYIIAFVHTQVLHCILKHHVWARVPCTAELMLCETQRGWRGGRYLEYHCSLTAITLTNVVLPEFCKPTSVSSISSFQKRLLIHSITLLMNASILLPIARQIPPKAQSPFPLHNTHTI